MLVGNRNRAGVSAPADPDAFSERVDADRVAWTAEAAARRFPGFADAEAVGGYASVYALTPDLEFVIERSPKVPGLVHALGFSGDGPSTRRSSARWSRSWWSTAAYRWSTPRRFHPAVRGPPMLQGRYGSWPF